MDKNSIKSQLKNNTVAIISLTIAIMTLLYTGWRENKTEKHRNIRVAGFEVLKNLGELQVVVNQAYFTTTNMQTSPFEGWGYISLISDLSQLLPEPVPQEAEKLADIWGVQWQKVVNDEMAVNQISGQIDKSREAVLHIIEALR